MVATKDSGSFASDIDDSAKGSQDTGTTASDQYAKDDAEFVRIVTQRYMYNAEACKGFPLVGWLLNRLPMPPIKGRDWDAFLIRTTRPTKAVDREGNVVDVVVGDEVLIPATYELASFFTKAATNADACYEVRIAPTTKEDIGGGQNMWHYDLAAKPRPARRSGFGLAAVLGANIRQLSPADGARDGDIPF